ncbi:MAG: Rpn family recombination-promoting nuclease/putative transposase [Chthoniobacterales bacterium]
MPRYLNPKSDLVFKKIFGKPHNELLKSFLNAILPLPNDCIIESLEYLSPEHVPEIAELKSSIVDVCCIDNHNRTFIVEMQLQWVKDFIQRMLFNTAATYVSQLKKGESYEKLSPVYGVAIIDANFTDEAEWFHHYQMRKNDNPNKNLEEIQLVLIELPKLKPTTRAEKKLAVLWLRFLKETNDQTEEVAQELLEIEPIKEALKLTEIAAYTRDELLIYNKGWDIISSQKTLISGKYREGEAKGLAQGKAEGKAEVAINLHYLGLSIDQICQATKMTKEQIQNIIEKN